MTVRPSDSVLLTVTGRDGPDTTARLTGLLADAGAELLDVEQVVVQGLLTLALLVRLPDSARSTGDEGPLQALRALAGELGVTVDVRAVAPVSMSTSVPPGPEPLRYVVTAVGRTLGAREVHALTARLAAQGARVERITRLSETPLGSVELHVTLPPGVDPSALKRALLAAGEARAPSTARCSASRSPAEQAADGDGHGLDAHPHRGHRRAGARARRGREGRRHHRAGDAWARWTTTSPARAGGAARRASTCAVLHELAANLPLTEGAETLLRVLKRLGYRTAVSAAASRSRPRRCRSGSGIDFA